MDEGLESDEATTDDEHELLLKEVPSWLKYEKDIAALIATFDEDADVQHNVKLEGIVSKEQRQVDVLIDGLVSAHPMRIAVECKRYAKPLGIGMIDQFVGKLLDLDVDQGTIYAFSGFTAGAEARAAKAFHPKITLESADPSDPPVDWGAVIKHFTGWGDCPNDNCMTGDITWHSVASDAEPVQAGNCYACGTEALACPECGVPLLVDYDEAECDGCGRHFAASRDSDGLDIEYFAITLGT